MDFKLLYLNLLVVAGSNQEKDIRCDTLLIHGCLSDSRTKVQHGRGEVVKITRREDSVSRPLAKTFNHPNS